VNYKSTCLNNHRTDFLPLPARRQCATLMVFYLCIDVYIQKTRDCIFSCSSALFPSHIKAYRTQRYVFIIFSLLSSICHNFLYCFVICSENDSVSYFQIHFWMKSYSCFGWNFGWNYSDWNYSGYSSGSNYSGYNYFGWNCSGSNYSD